MIDKNDIKKRMQKEGLNPGDYNIKIKEDAVYIYKLQ